VPLPAGGRNDWCQPHLCRPCEPRTGACRPSSSDPFAVGGAGRESSPWPRCSPGRD
jgi:hypothetical protein